jgi:V/A-type H+/Na+-transporting ATPase subunit D
MDPNTFPTKGNLMLAKSSLALANQGFELMDKKRNILIKELMGLISEATTIQAEIDITFTNAYQALQKANIELGIHNVEELSKTVPEETSVQIKLRSIMGTEIPLVEFDDSDYSTPTYSFHGTRLSLDEAFSHFNKVKKLTLHLSMIENSAYRLATSIKKTQKRANALQNITIPFYKTLRKDIQNALEEKEREEFTRLKVIKKMQSK